MKNNTYDKDAITGADPFVQGTYRLRESERLKLKTIVAIKKEVINDIIHESLKKYIKKHEDILYQPVRKKHDTPDDKPLEIPKMFQRKSKK